MKSGNSPFVAAIAAVGLAAAATIGIGLHAARAATIIDEWASVKLPAPPELKPVTVDPKTTALLMLDFTSQNCGKRPRCLASIPAVQKLLGEARAAKATVIYSIIPTVAIADIIKDVAPRPDEPWVQAGADKFVGTDLAKMLKDKGIQTVIVSGTASNGAVLFTAADAAFRGMNVIVPVDGISASDSFAELGTVYDFKAAPSLAAKTTLTRTDMIKF